MREIVCRKKTGCLISVCVAFLLLLCILPADILRAATPKVLVVDYSVKPSKIQSGSAFTLTLTVRNTSKNKIKNMKLTVASEAGEILPEDGTGSTYVSELAGESENELTFSMYAAAGLQEKSYKLIVKMEYEDGYGTPYTMEDTIYLPVTLEQRLSVTDILSDDVKVGEDVEVTAQINNLGDGMLYNVSAILEGDHVEKQNTYIGNIEAGKSGMIDLIAKTVKTTEVDSGRCADFLTVTYEDREGNEHHEKFDVWLSVDTTNYENLEALKEAPEKKTVSGRVVVWMVVIGIVVLVVVWNGIRWKKKRKRLEEF